MHTTDTSDVIYWNHNGDFSGDVILNIESGALQEQLHTPVPQMISVHIPFEDIKRLVAYYIRDRQIEYLQDASADQILSGDPLGWPKGND